MVNFCKDSCSGYNCGLIIAISKDGMTRETRGQNILKGAGANGAWREGAMEVGGSTILQITLQKRKLGNSRNSLIKYATLILNFIVIIIFMIYLYSLYFSGPPRQPPQSVIDHMKMLDKSLGLDYMFCKSRNPDFLLDIIHSQVGKSASHPFFQCYSSRFVCRKFAKNDKLRRERLL